MRVHKSRDLKSVHKEHIWNLLGSLCIKTYYIVLICWLRREANLHGSCQSHVVWKCLCIPDTLCVNWRIISYFYWFACMHIKLVFLTVPNENKWTSSSDHNWSTLSELHSCDGEGNSCPSGLKRLQLLFFLVFFSVLFHPAFRDKVYY